MSDKLLTESDYNKILQARLNHKSFKFLHGELQPISENIEGFLGEHYKLHITYQGPNDTEEVEHFFLKTRPSKKGYQEAATYELNVYEREIFTYDVLLKEFAKMDYDISFSAKCYHIVPDSTLILQDITLDQYKLSERVKPFALDQIQALLTSLAMYHGAGFAYERSKTKELGRRFTLGAEYNKTMEEIFIVSCLNHKSFSMDWWNSSFQAIDKIIDLLSMKESKKRNFKKIIKDAEFGKIFVTETTLPKTCSHGDLWSNNMMFKRTENGSTKCCLLDFQIGRYFYPSFDVLLAIFFNTTVEFRKVHLSELYQFYYDTLARILHNYGYSIVDILTLEEFHTSITLVKYEVLIQVASGNILFYIPAATLTDFVQGGSESMQDVLFHKKDQLALESFKNNETFRKTITDNLMDIYDFLLTGS